MTGVTNAELAAALQAVVAQVDAREDQLKDWQAGSPEGGPYGDGRYPIVNLLGETGYFKSPARLAYEVGLLTTSADGALTQCLLAQAAAEAAATLSETKANAAASSATTATTKAAEANDYRLQAAADKAAVEALKTAVDASVVNIDNSVTLVEGIHDEVVLARDEAVAAQTAAEAAAAAAATFNPSDYYTKIAADARFLQLTNFTWANLSGKPSTFTPSAHTHTIAEVTGLQAALDGKQAAGSYAAAAHTHVIGEVTGLQDALNAKADGSHSHNVIYSSTADFYGGLQNWNVIDRPDINPDSGWWYGIRVGHGSAESYYSTTLAVSFFTDDFKFRRKAGGVDQTWRTVWHDGNFNPATKADASHTHSISQVSGLQAALDGKQATLGYTPVNRGGDTMTGTLTMSSSPIIMAFSGSLPYMDLQATGVSGGRNYRIRSGIEGLTNGGFSIRDLTSGTNVLGVDSTGTVFAYNGLYVSGGAVFRSDWTNDYQSSSDFVDGTLVTTDIPADVLHGDSFEIEITGKSYNAANPPFKVIAQGYLYNGGIIAYSGISYGGDFSDNIKVFEEGGVLKFWWPRISYWNSFRVNVVASISPTNGTITRNRVTSITNSTEPTGAKKVTISLHRTIKSDPGSFTHINRPYANLLSLFNTGGTGTRIQLADNVWSANIRQDSGNLMFQTQGENTRLFIGNAQVGVNGTPDSSFQVFGALGSGMRIGFSGVANNYFDADVQNFRQANLTAQLSLGTSYVYAHKDLYALSGNIFVREDPNGAGAGMRLHHSGGGAYIDFDGNLNFRTGTGGGLASINSDGSIIADTVQALTQVYAGVGGNGRVFLNGGSVSNPGYISWYHPNGTRLGYMGWAEGTNIIYQAEAGWGLKFNVSTVQFGGDLLRVHAPANGTSSIRITQPGVDDMIAMFRTGNSAGPIAWQTANTSCIYTSGGVLKIGGGGAGHVQLVNGAGIFSDTVHTMGQVRAGGWYNTPNGTYHGLAVEMGVSGSNGYIYAYDRNAGAYGPLRLGGSNIYAENPFTFNSTAVFGSTVDIYGGNLRLISGGGDSAMGAYMAFRNSVGERGWVGYGEGNSRMRVNNSIGSVWVSGTDVQLVVNNAGSSARVATAYGYADIGPLNSSWCHYNTDRPAHYFNTAVHVNGAIMRYNEGAALHHGSSSMGSGRITVSTSSPSGGADGDVWFKVT